MNDNHRVALIGLAVSKENNLTPAPPRGLVGLPNVLAAATSRPFRTRHSARHVAVERPLPDWSV